MTAASRKFINWAIAYGARLKRSAREKVRVVVVCPGVEVSDVD